jgi:hypothetical protein
MVMDHKPLTRLVPIVALNDHTCKNKEAYHSIIDIMEPETIFTLIDQSGYVIKFVAQEKILLKNITNQVTKAMVSVMEHVNETFEAKYNALKDEKDIKLMKLFCQDRLFLGITRYRTYEELSAQEKENLDLDLYKNYKFWYENL